MSPIHPNAALRDLVRAWQQSVEDDPDATLEYREWARQVVADTFVSIEDGATAYQTVIFALAPVFAAHGEETVEVVECRDDEDDAATAERALPAGEDHLRARARGGVGMIAPIYLELGDTPGNTPETPPEHREAARDALELLLGGWERAVQEADVGDRYRQTVAETVERISDSLQDHTTAHNLICTLLAPAFLLPDEADMTGLTTADLESLGATLHWGEDTNHLYASLFDLEAPE